MPKPYSPQKFSEKQLSVLVIEDQKEICLLLRALFCSLGYICVPASDGLEALEKLTEREFDLVLADISHPGRDGTELIRIIRAEFAGVDLVAITGNQRQYRYADIIRAGASDFITRPFSFDELEAKFKRIVRERCLLAELKAFSKSDGPTGQYNRCDFDNDLEGVPDEALRIALT